jgi:ribosomal protein S18 acetylase RimI-like enzyme
MFIKVRTDEQIAQVEQLARTIWKEYFSPMIGSEIVDYLLETLQSTRAIADQIHEGYQYFIIQPEQNAVGYFAILHKKETDELFLSKLYILASERGKGRGKTAMQYIESMAQRENCKKIFLTVFHKNTSTIAAYERMGFRKTGSIRRDVGNHIVIHDFSMEKTLI